MGEQGRHISLPEQYNASDISWVELSSSLLPEDSYGRSVWVPELNGKRRPSVIFEQPIQALSGVRTVGSVMYTDLVLNGFYTIGDILNAPPEAIESLPQSTQQALKRNVPKYLDRQRESAHAKVANNIFKSVYPYEDPFRNDIPADKEQEMQVGMDAILKDVLTLAEYNFLLEKAGTPLVGSQPIMKNHGNKLASIRRMLLNEPTRSALLGYATTHQDSPAREMLGVVFQKDLPVPQLGDGWEGLPALISRNIKDDRFREAQRITGPYEFFRALGRPYTSPEITNELLQLMQDSEGDLYSRAIEEARFQKKQTELLSAQMEANQRRFEVVTFGKLAEAARDAGCASVSEVSEWIRTNGTDDLRKLIRGHNSMSTDGLLERAIADFAARNADILS